jgi:hypothetical protein
MKSCCPVISLALLFGIIVKTASIKRKVNILISGYLCAFLLCMLSTEAQPVKAFGQLDSMFNSEWGMPQQWYADSALHRFFGHYKKIHIPAADSVSAKLLKALKPAFPSLREKPLVSGFNGWLQYGLLYNSRIDTPFVEKGLIQHQLQLQVQTVIAKNLPLTVYGTVRRSNSAFFQDVFDLRADIDFDMMKELQVQRWQKAVQSKLEQADVTAATAQLKALQKMVANWNGIVNRASMQQRYLDYLSLLKNPAILTDSIQHDTVLQKNQQALLQKAEKFVLHYRKLDSIYHYYKTKADSLQTVLGKYQGKFQQYRQMISMARRGGPDLQTMQAWVAKRSMEHPELQRLLPLLKTYKKLSLGRTLINRNDLVTNNTRINGINFEYYNRWYVAVTAGAVDFRIRDFVTRKQLKLPKESILQLKLGLGRPDATHLMLSYFSGRRQDLFGQRGARGEVQLKPVNGVGVAGRWQLTGASYLQMEVAHSLTGLPVRPGAGAADTKTRLAQWQSKALLTKLHIRLPRLQTILDGQYRFFGGRYHSFANNRVIGDFQQWSIQASQVLWKNRLRLNAYVRTFEYDNTFTPLLLNTRAVVKGFIASYRQRKMPLLNISYIPATQIVNNNGQLSQNNYQVLNVNVHHQYKIGLRKTMASLMVNRFYNQSPDSNFSFYNARGIYYRQQIWFTHFTGTMGVNYNKNNFSEWTLLEGGVQAHVTPRFSGGVQGSVINMNGKEVKTGFQTNIQARLWKEDYLNIGYQRSFLPVSGGGFTTNDFMNIQFNKKF